LTIIDRCPHLRDICRNVAFHPRHDVVYLKNAEGSQSSVVVWMSPPNTILSRSAIIQWLWFLQGMQSICIVSQSANESPQWARVNPSPKQPGYYSNPGWPGCCRPPNANEQGKIQPADWRAVSIIHHVPIPPEIQALLDKVSTRAGPISALGGGPSRGSGGSSSMPSLDRKNSGNASPKTNASSVKSTTIPPSKGRSGGSPQQLSSSLTSTGPKGSAVPSSLPNSSIADRYRQLGVAGKSEERLDPSNSSNSSPVRKQIELDGTISRRSSNRRPSVSNALPATSISKAAVETQASSSALRNRVSTSNANVVAAKPSIPRPPDRQAPVLAVRTQTRRSNVEPPSPMSAISSASSSSGSSDSILTDGTVTTDGGFTDYLSEESEEELQRQAEAKAILLAQTQAEENEFKAARQRLENVDLRPPKSWNPGRNPSTSPSRAPPQQGGYSNSPYSTPTYASSAVAHAGSQARV
jgi:hypothetical protein